MVYHSVIAGDSACS